MTRSRSAATWRERAARKGRRLRAHPRELPPGRYTVILEPAAVLDLVGQMFGDFSATAIRDGRSFLNDRIGQEAVRREHHDSRRCASSAAGRARPFDGEGVPRQRLTLVENGVVREIAYSRQAARAGRSSSPPATAFRCPTNSAKRR